MIVRLSDTSRPAETMHAHGAPLVARVWPFGHLRAYGRQVAKEDCADEKPKARVQTGNVGEGTRT